jgi:hypothetical protein
MAGIQYSFPLQGHEINRKYSRTIGTFHNVKFLENADSSILQTFLQMCQILLSVKEKFGKNFFFFNIVPQNLYPVHRQVLPGGKRQKRPAGT